MKMTNVKILCRLLCICMVFVISADHWTEKTFATDAWFYDGVTIDKPFVQKSDDLSINIKANVRGSTSNLRYKFVWMKDHWKQWGVVQEFSRANFAIWKPSQSGDYTIYVDVRDSSGQTFTKMATCTIWCSEGATFAQGSSVQPNAIVDINAKLSPPRVLKNLQYKFVWMKDGWSKWGVIKNFSQSASARWITPRESGVYKIYVDVKGIDGKVSTGITDLILELPLNASDFLSMSESDVIEKIGPSFTANQKETGILASVSLAQFILESGYGKSELAVQTNNCFGMKKSLSGNSWDGSAWDGKSVYTKQTMEQEKDGTYITITADFRKYNSVIDSIADHSAYLLGAKNGDKLRYDGIKDEKNYRRVAQILKDGGYATNLTYMDKLCSIIERWSLTRYEYHD